MKIVIVGSGLAGVTVAEALAKHPEHEVHLVSAETRGYYARPRLSHGISCADEQAAKILLKPFDAFAPRIRVHRGVRAERIDRERMELVLAGDEKLGYDALILATGSAARIPAGLRAHQAAFFTLNSLDDLVAIRQRRAAALERGRQPHWAVIGGGLIGCELASDFAKACDAVTLFHAAPRLLELQLDEEQSAALHEHFIAQGVAVRYQEDVRAIRSGALGTEVVNSGGGAGRYSAAIVCTGFAPRVELAQSAGLAVGRGIVVNPYLMSPDPAIFAVGDVAEVNGRLFPYVSPIRSQALWLAEHLAGRSSAPWSTPQFAPIAKIHGFTLTNRSAAVSGPNSKSVADSELMRLPRQPTGCA